MLASLTTDFNFIQNHKPIGLLASYPHCVVSALRVLWYKILKWAASCWERITIICLVAFFVTHKLTYTHRNRHDHILKTLRLSHACVPSSSSEDLILHVCP